VQFDDKKAIKKNVESKKKREGKKKERKKKKLFLCFSRPFGSCPGR
jgi:hypothetical protein